MLDSVLLEQIILTSVDQQEGNLVVVNVTLQLVQMHCVVLVPLLLDVVIWQWVFVL